MSIDKAINITSRSGLAPAPWTRWQGHEGLDTKAGFYMNAVSIDVFDAETGNLIESTVAGDYQGRARK
jgi:hypothetical protein